MRPAGARCAGDDLMPLEVVECPDRSRVPDHMKRDVSRCAADVIEYGDDALRFLARLPRRKRSLPHPGPGRDAERGVEADGD